jgi:hypothetical protein
MTTLTKREDARDRERRELDEALAKIGARVIVDQDGAVGVGCPRGREDEARRIMNEHGIIV